MAVNILFQPRQSWATRTLSEYPFRIKVLGNNSDRRDVFELRYRAYRNDGHIAPNSARTFRDSNDGLETTAQIAAYDGEVCVGALRVSFSPPPAGGHALPCAAYYPEVADLLREPDRRFVEISRLAIDPEISNTSQKTTLYASLVRAGLMAAEAGHATDILIATKPEWVRFYKFMIGCTQIGKSAKYPPGDLEITR